MFDHENQALTDQCVRALRRIFVLCDRDMDDALNDAELNDFQVFDRFRILLFCFSFNFTYSENTVFSLVVPLFKTFITSIG